MITFLAAFVLRAVPGLAPAAAIKVAKWVAIVGAVFAAVAIGLIIAERIGDAREKEIAAERLADAHEADRRAALNEIARAAAREAASKTTTRQLETIHAEDPDNAVRPASAADRAVANRLRAR